MITNENLVVDTNANGFIRVSNSGGFVAYFVVGYNLNGRRQVKISPTITSGNSWAIGIPLNATVVRLEVYIAVYIQSWMLVYRRGFQTAPRICFGMNGTVFDAKCFQIPCLSGNNGILPVGDTPNCCCNCCCSGNIMC